MLLKNSTYDRIKDTVVKYLPRLGAFYFAISVIWGLPYGKEIEGTILAICALLGIVMTESTKKYNQQGKGEFK